jgi:hypothetical protein
VAPTAIAPFAYHQYAPTHHGRALTILTHHRAQIRAAGPQACHCEDLDATIVIAYPTRSRPPDLEEDLRVPFDGRWPP